MAADETKVPLSPETARSIAQIAYEAKKLVRANGSGRLPWPYESERRSMAQSAADSKMSTVTETP